jgi:membrane protein implicated in regulation of membrane protease activity
MKVLLAVAAVATSMPLLAAESGDQKASQPNQTQERLVCRRVGVVASQSRLGRQRVCMTAAQWRARSDMSADDVMDGMEPMLRTQGRPTDPPI